MPSWLSWVKDYFTVIAGAIGVITGTAALWVTLDLPVPASRAYVQTTVEPFYNNGYSLLLIRRQLCVVELFQWESNKVKDQNIVVNIARLKDEIADIDRLIAEFRKDHHR